MRNQLSKVKDQGFSMIEVLVTMLIIALALLGAAGLQASAMKAGVGAKFRNQAVFLVDDLVERMEANRAQAASGVYVTGLTTTTNCVTSACTPDTLAAYDVRTWASAVAAVLPSGTATVAASGVNPSTYTITVNWVDRATKNTAGNTTENFSLITTKMINQ